MQAATIAPIAGLSSVSKSIHDAQEKTKGYLPTIEAAVGNAVNQCIDESNLDKELVKYNAKTVGKVNT